MDVRALAGATLGGLVTAGAIAAVLGSLDEYQVHDFADQDFTIGVAYGLVATVAAVGVIALIHFLIGGPRRHVVVPLLLVPLAVVPLVAGAERNRVEAALLWGAAAIAVHALIAYGKKGSAVVVVLAVLLTWAAQERWRAQKFEAVGLPLVVPDIAGYRLTGTWAGRYSVSMTLRDPSGRRVHAVVEGPGSSRGGCGSSPDRRRLVPAAPPAREYAIFCLRDDATLTLVPGGDEPLADLVPLVTPRETDAAEFADHPDDNTMAEPD
ncbi:hypothetical protein [Symbioplanes lichenis]|uniref:hypothetical protein n=1 Tax=Symbioplanes lichenis TaxID=1629072 RepID=UPI002738AF60|nr:hypothetical protein [Actinoplanes lichenis]